MTRFEGRIAVVTGAGNGIGRATSARLISEGATVVGVDLDAAALAVTAHELGGAFEPFPADVSDDTAENDYIAETLRRHGRLDIAFLNAGVLGTPGPVHEVPIAEFDHVMAVNVRGVWLGTARALAVMREQRSGVITITSSTGGLRGSGGLGPYIASKHAVVGIMKSAAIEGGPFGVRVNAIHPGPTDTAVWSGAVGTKSGESAGRPGLPQLYRVAEPAEIAALVAFLSSDEAGFSTGASFLADGGLLAGPPYAD
jgi:NAD(P)-dependent dehydrogenase (short-subunit alcohol dehydrogenase family)